jgi:hypothetical protein
MTATEVTATSVLRASVKARDRSPQVFARLARDLGVSNDQLASFAAGGPLPVETLKALAVLIFEAEFVPETDRLRPRPAPEPRSYVKPELADLEAERPGMPEPWGPHHVGGVVGLAALPSPKRPGWE